MKTKKTMSNETLQSICNYGQYIAGILTALFAIGNVYYGNVVAQEDKRQNANAGVIKPEIQPNKQLADVLTVELGSITAHYPKEDFGQGAYDVGRLMTGAGRIKCRYENGQILLTTTVVDRDQKVVCELVDNEWIANPGNFFKRNYSDNAVEVIDQYGDVAVSVELLNNNYIRINGIIHTPGEGFLFVSKSYMSRIPELAPNASLQEKQKWDRAYRERADYMKKIFVYTGKDFLGKRVSTQGNKQ